jgi:hypothetical protein
MVTFDIETLTVLRTVLDEAWVVAESRAASANDQVAGCDAPS